MKATLVLVALAFTPAACTTGDDPVPPDDDPVATDDSADAGPVSADTLPFMSSCDVTNDQCDKTGQTELICFSFNSKGPHCTHSCANDTECGTPSPGCNNKGVCKAPDQ